MTQHIFGNTFKDSKAKKKPWYYIIELGRDANGKRQQVKRRGWPSQKEARAAMKEHILILESNEIAEDNEITFNQYMEEFLKNRQKNLRETTSKLHELYYRNHLSGYFGKYKLKEITPRHIQNFINFSIDDKKLSNEYVGKMIIFLKIALKHAVKPLKLIKENPCDDIKLPKKACSQITVWNQEQINLFINEGFKVRTGKRKILMQYHYYLVATTSLLTGMRKGEILGLRWTDIDFENNVIHVRQILDGLGKIVPGGKTRSSTRSISAPVKLMSLLENLKEVQKSNEKKYEQKYKNDLVFKTRYGGKLDHRHVIRAFKEIAYSLDLPIIRFHDLRHSHATLLLQQNVNVKIVSDRLGHTDIATTMNVYSHVLPSMQREVADKLDNIF